MALVHYLHLSNRLKISCFVTSGLETARALASHNAHVVMACRSLESAEEAKMSILKIYVYLFFGFTQTLVLYKLNFRQTPPLTQSTWIC